jgi:hypothetical protein
MNNECPNCGVEGYRYVSGWQNNEPIEPDEGWCDVCGYHYVEHCEDPEREQIKRFRSISELPPKIPIMKPLATRQGLADRDERIAELEKLREYVQHKQDCWARQKFYMRECPHCGSAKNHWRDGAGFEGTRLCEECDGPGYVPKERFGECTCGLEQILWKALKESEK